MRQTLLSDWREVAFIVFNLWICTALAAAIDPTPNSLLLAVVLVVTITQNQSLVDWRGRIQAFILLPFIIFSTAIVGHWFHTQFYLAAAGFCAAMFFAIWLRKFGVAATRAGSLLALPFITLLILPSAKQSLSLWELTSLSLAIFLIIVLTRFIGEYLNFLSPMRDIIERPDPNKADEKNNNFNFAVSTRMAIQMLITLVVAFLLGRLFFPNHFNWIVLTAYLVTTGNRGRADVLYKGSLRVLGAALGLFIAFLSLKINSFEHYLHSGFNLSILLLCLLCIGVWLRSWNYAAWTLIVIFAASLLQDFSVGFVGDSYLLERITCILIGAVCAIFAAWFIFPIKSSGVVRKRMGEILAKASAYMADSSDDNKNQLQTSLRKLDDIVAPWKLWYFLSRNKDEHFQPWVWIDLTQDCIEKIIQTQQFPKEIRLLLGETRKSLLTPEKIKSNLEKLKMSLEALKNSQEE